MSYNEFYNGLSSSIQLTVRASKIDIYDVRKIMRLSLCLSVHRTHYNFQLHKTCMMVYAYSILYLTSYTTKQKLSQHINMRIGSQILTCNILVELQQAGQSSQPTPKFYNFAFTSYFFYSFNSVQTICISTKPLGCIFILQYKQWQHNEASIVN